MSDEAKGAVGAILQWRRILANPESGRSRAARARLRRCATVADALLEGPTIDLIKAIQRESGAASSRPSDEQLVALAVLAMALAHAADSGGRRKFAEALGRTPDDQAPSENDRARFSPLRFRALIEAARERDWDRLARALRRAFAILDEAPLDVKRFASDLLYLDDRILRRWTYEYWQTPPPSDLQQSDASDLPVTESLP